MCQCFWVLTNNHRAGLINMRIRVRIAYVFIGVTYIATICSILFGCHPMHKNWQIYPNPGSTSLVIFNDFILKLTGVKISASRPSPRLTSTLPLC